MIPEGWATAEFPGFKFKISRGIPSSGFTPNIAVVDEAFDGSVEYYVTACLGPMGKDTQGFKLLEKKPFDTDSGIKGKMLVINCSALPEDGPKFADIFDTAMKTFQIIEPKLKKLF
jgi:hypothetical protein